MAEDTFLWLFLAALLVVLGLVVWLLRSGRPARARRRYSGGGSTWSSSPSGSSGWSSSCSGGSGDSGGSDFGGGDSGGGGAGSSW